MFWDKIYDLLMLDDTVSGTMKAHITEQYASPDSEGIAFPAWDSRHGQERDSEGLCKDLQKRLHKSDPDPILSVVLKYSCHVLFTTRNLLSGGESIYLDELDFDDQIGLIQNLYKDAEGLH